MFDLDQFIADLRAALPERSRQAMKEIVARAVSNPASLLQHVGEPAKARIKILHQANDLTVINVMHPTKSRFLTTICLPL
jgi:hypothetical protein